jgi:hypothetical protein
MAHWYIVIYPCSVTSSTWDKWTAIGTLVLAAGTILLAIIALFQENIQRRFRRSHLTLEIRKAPPDTHQIAMKRYVDTGKGSVLELPQIPALYVRARIIHVKGPSANQVEIVVEKVWNGHGKGRTPRDTFLPLSLSWAHFGGSTIAIPHGIFRYCDVGRFVKDEKSEKTFFMFTTVVQPNAVATGSPPNVLEAGDYEFELMMTGDNVKPVRTTWRLSFLEEWSEDESEMLKRIVIAPVDPEETQFSSVNSEDSTGDSTV